MSGKLERHAYDAAVRGEQAARLLGDVIDNEVIGKINVNFSHVSPFDRV